MLLQIVSWIFFGGLVGWITALTIHSEESGKMALNIAIGIVGALIGGFILRSLNFTTGINNFDVASIITAVVGSIMLIALARGFNRA